MATTHDSFVRGSLPSPALENEARDAAGSCLVFSSKGTKIQVWWLQNSSRKAGRGSHKTTVMFSCFVLSCLFFPEAILAWYKSLQGAAKSSCGSLRPRPSNQVVYQTLPGTGNNRTGTFASGFQKQPPKVWARLGTSLHG